MKRSNLTRKPPLLPAQKALREAYKLGKQELKALSGAGRPRIAQTKNRRNLYYKGVKYDSEWEIECFKVLEYREMAKEISDLKTHQVINFVVKNEAGKELKLNINIDFTFYDNRLKRFVRADAKPPKKLDGQKKDWFLRWDLLRLVEPDFQYILYRMHSTWRDIDI